MERWYFLPKTIVKNNVLLVTSSCYILGSIEFCDSFMKGHTTADQYGAQKFGFISSTVVLVTIVSISATASCFGVDIFRPPYLCSNIICVCW